MTPPLAPDIRAVLDDPARLKALVEQENGFAAAGRKLGISSYPVRQAWTTLKLPPFVRTRRQQERPQAVAGKAPTPDMSGVTVTGDTAVVITSPKQEVDLGDVDKLLRDRNLDPAHWHVERLTVNEWQAYAGRDENGDAHVVELRQLKAFLRKKPDLAWVFPAVDVPQRYVPTATTRGKADRLVAVLCDQQAPYHDEDLHQAVLRWLADVQPDEIALAGDTIDLPTISRHADNPRWAASVQECLNVGHRLLSDYVDAAPASKRRKLRGNHDWRMESELLTRAERMFGIRPADVPGEPEGAAALSLRRLLHLDRLGIELVGEEGDHWKFGEIPVADGLVVRHKPPSKQGRRVKASVIAGDSHRQSIEQTTEWEDGLPVFRTIVHAGTLAAIRGGLGYALDPDWQQGFATAAVRADGEVTYDLAYWRSGRLTWRGETW